MIRAGDQWNRTQVIRQDINIYNIIIIIIKSETEVKSDENKHGKTSGKSHFTAS